MQMVDREREFYKKFETGVRDKNDDAGRYVENETCDDFHDSKKETENDLKRERDYDVPREKDAYKEREKKSPSPYDDYHSRNELRENRFHRESRESLRDESYVLNVCFDKNLT